MCGFGGGGGDGGAGAARAAEEARQARIRSGMDSIDKTFGQFDDTFYGTREKAYNDYAMPQLEGQYNDAYSQLVYALAGKGLLSSSVGASKLGDLKEAYDTNRQAVVAQGRQYANQARSDMESSRSQLVQMLNTSADGDAAARDATTRAATLSASPAFSPLGNMFQNVGSLGANYVNELTGGKGLIGARLFSNPTNTRGASYISS